MAQREIAGVHLPKSKTTQRTFEAILASAEKLFSQNGYLSTTISDITKAANVATGSFYSYFESKYAVYEYILERYKAELKSSLAKNIEGCTTRAERERVGLKTFIQDAVRNPRCFHLVWESLYINPDLFRRYYQSFAESYARALSRDKEELTTNDLSMAAYVLIGINNFMGLKALFEQADEESIDKLVDGVMEILQKGLFVEK
ncbi:MAG: TetR/AcrR family transcriptional regulator [Clostridia bacterium]|nr:TetR/AcrR family transcriptional regulator [Clostridia bacterium]